MNGMTGDRPTVSSSVSEKPVTGCPEMRYSPLGSLTDARAAGPWQTAAMILE